MFSEARLMRSVLLATALIAFATPAMAAPSNTQRDMERMAATLNDPVTQEAMGGALSQMLGTLLDMRVDGIARSLEPLNGGKRIRLRGNTLREIALRDDPNFDAKLNTGSRAMIGSMGAMLGAVAPMIPQLEEAADRMEDAIKAARRRARAAE
jgi:hypothetical protein